MSNLDSSMKNAGQAVRTEALSWGQRNVRTLFLIGLVAGALIGGVIVHLL